MTSANAWMRSEVRTASQQSWVIKFSSAIGGGLANVCVHGLPGHCLDSLFEMRKRKEPTVATPDEPPSKTRRKVETCCSGGILTKPDGSVVITIPKDAKLVKFMGTYYSVEEATPEHLHLTKRQWATDQQRAVIIERTRAAFRRECFERRDDAEALERKIAHLSAQVQRGNENPAFMNRLRGTKSMHAFHLKHIKELHGQLCWRLECRTELYEAHFSFQRNVPCYYEEWTAPLVWHPRLEPSRATQVVPCFENHRPIDDFGWCEKTCCGHDGPLRPIEHLGLCCLTVRGLLQRVHSHKMYNKTTSTLRILKGDVTEDVIPPLIKLLAHVTTTLHLGGSSVIWKTSAVPVLKHVARRECTIQALAFNEPIDSKAFPYIAAWIRKPTSRALFIHSIISEEDFMNFVNVVKTSSLRCLRFGTWLASRSHAQQLWDAVHESNLFACELDVVQQTGFWINTRDLDRRRARLLICALRPHFVRNDLCLLVCEYLDGMDVCFIQHTFAAPISHSACEWVVANY